MFERPATDSNGDPMHFQQTLGLNLMNPLVFGLVLALGLAGCDLGDKQIGDEGTTDAGDGDGGDGDGDGGDGDGDGDAIGPCGEETISSLPTNPEDYFTSPLDAFDGQSVNDILAVIEGNYAGAFTWGPAEGVVIPSHAGTESPLTVTATFTGSDAILTEVPLAGQWVEDSPLALLCTNTLELEVTLDFATEDGVFDESLVVLVTAISHGDPEGSGTDPSVYHHLDMDAHQGSLTIADFDVVEGGTLTDLVLLFSFGEASLTGSLNAEVLTMDWVGFGSVAGFDAARVP
jgi:hypothetical protein